MPGKQTDAFRFSDLPGSFHDQGFVIGIVFPCQQFFINFPPQQFHDFSVK
jgi:hypothetical protein